MKVKVISLLQPWASLVVLGHKRIETRSWNTKYRGELLIHASAKFTKAHKDMGRHFNRNFGTSLGDVDDLPVGSIIGKVNLVDTTTTSHFLSMFADKLSYGLSAQLDDGKEMAFGDFSAGRFGWLLSDPLQFAKPIPAKGSLGIWEWDMPDHFHVPVQGGQATFDNPPDRETLQAVEEMAKIAYTKIKK